MSLQDREPLLATLQKTIIYIQGNLKRDKSSSSRGCNNTWILLCKVCNAAFTQPITLSSSHLDQQQNHWHHQAWKNKTVLRAWLEHIFSSLYCPSLQRAGLSVHTLVATVSRGGSGWEKDTAKAPRSSVHALQDGHAAVITGATLQWWLLLHAACCGVESERFVCAFPILVSAAQDVNLPSTHRQATALLESRRKD